MSVDSVAEAPETDDIGAEDAVQAKKKAAFHDAAKADTEEAAQDKNDQLASASAKAANASPEATTTSLPTEPPSWFDQLKNKAGEAAAAITGFVEEKASEAKDAVGGAIADAKETVDDALKQTTENLKPLTDAVTTGYEVTKQALTDLPENLQQVADLTPGEAMQAAGATINEGLNTLKSLDPTLDTVISGAQQYAAELPGNLQEFSQLSRSEMLKAANGSLDEGLKNLKPVGKGMQDIGDNFRNNGVGPIAVVGQVIKDVGGLVENSSEIKEVVGKAAADGADYIGKIANGQEKPDFGNSIAGAVSGGGKILYGLAQAPMHFGASIFGGAVTDKVDHALNGLKSELDYGYKGTIAEYGLDSNSKAYKTSSNISETVGALAMLKGGAQKPPVEVIVPTNNIKSFTRPSTNPVVNAVKTSAPSPAEAASAANNIKTFARKPTELVGAGVNSGTVAARAEAAAAGGEAGAPGVRASASGSSRPAGNGASQGGGRAQGQPAQGQPPQQPTQGQPTQGQPPQQPPAASGSGGASGSSGSTPGIGTGGTVAGGVIKYPVKHTSQPIYGPALPVDRLTETIGNGVFKVAHKLSGSKKVVMLINEEGSSLKGLTMLKNEADALDELTYLGIPTVRNVELVKVQSPKPGYSDRTGLMMDEVPGMINSKDFAKYTDAEINARFTPQSYINAQNIKHGLEKHKINVVDFQYALGKKGEIMIIDPHSIADGVSPHISRTLDNLLDRIATVLKQKDPSWTPPK